MQGWRGTGASAVRASAGAFRRTGYFHPEHPGAAGDTSALSSLSQPPESRALRPSQLSRRLMVCWVWWYLSKTREPGFCLAPAYGCFGVCASGCPSEGPRSGFWVRAWCRPAAFKPQPRGRQIWRWYLPLKVQATGYSIPFSRVSCWKDERGSYSPHLKLYW